MNAMTEESWALSVTEATMQDWLTAMTLLPKAPAPVAVPRTALWPEDVRPIRRATVPRDRRRVVPAAGEPEVGSARVAGARTIYWLLLAFALVAVLAF